MAAQILSFAAARVREPLSRDWSSQELAEFYRVESALLQAGLALEGERGLSDEGDPWFVFCRADTGEVFIHFARVDGVYVVDGAAFGAPVRGRDFGSLVRDLIASHPLATVRRPGSNVMMHPAALLIALVGAAFFHSGKAKAAEPGDHAPIVPEPARAGERRGLLLAGGSPVAGDSGAASRFVVLDAAEVAAVLTGVAIGLREVAAAASSDDGRAPPPLPVSASLLHDWMARTGRALTAPDALGALAAPDVRAALTVMAVFHDLARTAAPAAAEAVTPAAAPAVLSAALAAVAAAPPALAPSPPQAAAPVLLVHLASGPAPQIEALALVANDGALARIAPDHVLHVDELPTRLLDLIHQGEIVVPTPPTPPGQGAGDLDGVAGPLPGHAAEATPPHAPSDGHVVASPGGSAPTGGPEVPAPSTPAPLGNTLVTASSTDTAPSPAPVPPVEHAPPSHSAAIDAAVIAFVSTVVDVKVMISGHDVVFYDPAILTLLPAGEVPDSITWRLEDGSSVSLVGTQTELHAFHGVG